MFDRFAEALDEFNVHLRMGGGLVRVVARLGRGWRVNGTSASSNAAHISFSMLSRA